jgi:hypothetical protein
LLQRFRHGHDDVEDDEEDVRVRVPATPTEAAVTNTHTPASRIAFTPHHVANPQGTTTITPAPPAAATSERRGSPSHDALNGILAESKQNNELQSKYAHLLTQVKAPKVALRKLQKKYDDLRLRFQTYLAKRQDPMELHTRAINLPFNDAREFDGSDVVNDSAIVKRKKTQKLVLNVLMQRKFFDGLVHSEILKQANI